MRPPNNIEVVLHPVPKNGPLTRRPPINALRTRTTPLTDMPNLPLTAVDLSVECVRNCAIRISPYIQVFGHLGPVACLLLEQWYRM